VHLSCETRLPTLRSGISGINRQIDHAGQRMDARGTGTFVLTAGAVPSNLHDSYAQFGRTYRVFNENGRLMIQALGQAPERLLKQEDGTFATRSSARNRISFVMRAERAVSMKMTSQGLPLSGDRVGDGDPKTFHRQLQ
jgi:hypothetical protein